MTRHIQPHACPVCGVYFDSRKYVKMHMYKIHKSSVPGAAGPADKSADQSDVIPSRAAVISELTDPAATHSVTSTTSLDATGSVRPSVVSLDTN